MGKGQSKGTSLELTPFEIEEAKVIQDKVDREGPDAIVQHIRENLDNWKNEAVNIGVSGRYKTGKSTFINAVLGLKPGEAGAAKSGSGNTTLRIENYEHPTNPRIILYDFPGVGTPEFPRETYMNNVKSSKCDYFLIFFDAVISEDDLWLAENLNINKPFCFVRSMIDQDIANADYDGKDRSEVLAEIRKTATTTMSQHDILKNSSIFFISGRHTYIGEFDKLLNHMEKYLPSLKFDAIIFSISILAREVIEKKYTKLKTRSRIVSAGAAAISAIPIPLVDLPVNIALIILEIKHYKHTFCFGNDNCELLPSEIKEKLRLRSILANSLPLYGFIVAQLGKLVILTGVQSVADLIIPGIGSIISSATTLITVNLFLSNLLGDFRHDALTVYDYITETQTRID